MNILEIPATIIRWFLYILAGWGFLFAGGCLIDRYVGWSDDLKPIRDACLSITKSAIAHATPHLQKLAINLKIEKKEEAKEEKEKEE